MRVSVYSAKRYDERFLGEANRAHGHELRFLEARLTPPTTRLPDGSQAVCAFVNDVLDRGVLEDLARRGVRLVALRSAGYNHVDLHAARDLGLAVTRVPAYSPAAVAEHTVALMLTLNRRIHRS